MGRCVGCGVDLCTSDPCICNGCRTREQQIRSLVPSRIRYHPNDSHPNDGHSNPYYPFERKYTNNNDPPAMVKTIQEDMDGLKRMVNEQNIIIQQLRDQIQTQAKTQGQTQAQTASITDILA